MAAVLLSDLYIRGLDSPTKGRLEISDAKVSGLVLRVTAGGVKSWSYRYHDRTTKKVERLSLGRFPQVPLAKARTLAEKHRGAVVDHQSPRALQRKAQAEYVAAKTVDQLLDKFVAEYVEKKTPKSAATTRSYLGAVRKAWGTRKAKDITRADAKTFLEKRAEAAPVASNRTRSILIRFFNWCVDEEILETSPMVRIKKYGEEKPKERVVSDEELKMLWPSFETLGDSMALTFRTLILLGQRPGEIIGLRLNELCDMHKPSDARIELPPERTKNGRRHVIPLSSEAQRFIAEALAQRSEDEDSPFVFVSWRNPGSGYDVRSFARAIKRMIRELEGISPSVKSLQADNPTPHAFRRTMITGLGRLGFQRELVKAVVNHAEGDILERHYDFYDKLPEKRRALEAWEAHVLTILGLRPVVENVVALAR